MTHRGATRDPIPGEYGLSRRGIPVQWRWLLPVVVGATTAAWVAGIVTGYTGGRLQFAIVVAGALLTATASGVPLWAQARTARSRADAVATAQSARAAMRIALEDALDPIVTMLHQLTTATGRERTRIRGQAVLMTLTSITQLATPIGDPETPRRLRVCFFAIEHGRSSRRLVPQTYAGRAGQPTATFDGTTRAGQYLLRIADEGWRTIDDTTTLRPAVWWDDDEAYRTFAAGPVPGPDGDPIGLLTIDSLTPGDLDEIDLPLVRLLAHVLAIAV